MGNPNHEPANLELPPSQTTDEFTGCPAFLRACVCPVLSVTFVWWHVLVWLWWYVMVLNAEIVVVPQVLRCQLMPSEPSSSWNCWHISATRFHSPKRWMWSQYRFGFCTVGLWTHQYLVVCSKCLLTFKSMQNYLKNISLSLWRCSQHKETQRKTEVMERIFTITLKFRLKFRSCVFHVISETHHWWFDASTHDVCCSS